MTTPVPARVFNPRVELYENCAACGGLGLLQAYQQQPVNCDVCAGTGRVRRGTHDPASAIDAEPEAARWLRWTDVAELAAKLPNDAELGQAIRALIGGGR